MLRVSLHPDGLAPMSTPPDMAAETGEPGVVVPVTRNAPQGRPSFLTTVTVFGAPRDVSVAMMPAPKHEPMAPSPIMWPTARGTKFTVSMQSSFLFGFTGLAPCCWPANAASITFHVKP